MHYTNKELLAEAYKRYPIGTKFLSILADGGKEREVQPYYSERKEMEYVIDTWEGERVVYVTGGMYNINRGGCSNPRLYSESKGWCPIVNDNTSNYEIY